MKTLTLLSFILLTLNPVHASDGFEPLFNGVDLTGWKIHGTEKWYVEDGFLVCESSPKRKYGYLATEKTYKDFILTLDFKQETKNGFR